MLENKTLFIKDEINGEDDVVLAIDKALELSLARKPMSTKVDIDKLFDLDSFTHDLTYDTLPVNECALPSILQAYKIGGGAFRDVRTTDDILCDIFKKMSYMVSPYAQILLSDGQIIGVRSERYKMVPLHVVLDEIIPSMSAYYDEYMKTEVEMSYSESFIKFLTDKEFTFNGTTKPLTITLKNSENGEASIGINAYIGHSTPIMKSINIIHTKNRATIEELRSVIGSLESVINQAFDNLKELEKIQLKKPYDAIECLQTKYKLGQCYCDNAKDRMNKDGVSSCTAANVYERLADEMMLAPGITRETKEGYQNDLLKILNFDWSAFI